MCDNARLQKTGFLELLRSTGLIWHRPKYFILWGKKNHKLAVRLIKNREKADQEVALQM